MKHKILIENEKQANLIVAKVMRITLLIFTFIYILDLIDVFVVNIKIMTIAYIGSAVLLLLPTLFVNMCKQNNSHIKYLNVIVAVVFTTLLSITLTYHVVVNYVYPIASLHHFHKEMVMGFATLVENKDGSTGGHIKRTSTYVKLLAEEFTRKS